MICPYLKSIHTMSYTKSFYLPLHIETDQLYIKFLKELLGEIALCCKRSKPSQRDRLLIKDLPLLLWHIVNQPGFKRKIS